MWFVDSRYCVKGDDLLDIAILPNDASATSGASELRSSRIAAFH